jgi:glycosyltransferase involved in cell wall biosynthesis
MCKICAIIPVYNHAGRIKAVLEGVLSWELPVFVINDGSTDHLLNVLQEFDKKITVISYSKNRGKGYALQCGFNAAQKAGYEYALTLDADGQHRKEDIPLLLNAIKKHPQSLIMGSRRLKNENMPSKNTFANRFSNFWVALQTLQPLPDTQTGFRIYPLFEMKKIKLFTNRFEAEIELLVRLAWKGIKIVPIKTNVFYPPKNERITHFRPGLDFLRISILNTLLTIMAFFYGYPCIVFHKLKKIKPVTQIKKL